jgi:branched-chain amino acid transport system substrate-binding protein
MMISELCWQKAVSAMVVGIAFFLTGCHPTVPVKEEPARPAVEDLWAQAEAYRDQGRLDKALDAYRTYVAQAPTDEKAALALHRMGEIYLGSGRYREAVVVLGRVSEQYPGYGELARVRYQMIKGLYALGDLARSRDEAVRWLQQYPHDPLRGDILVLLGDTYKSLGDTRMAFVRWVEAKEIFADNPQMQQMVKEKLDALINLSGLSELEEITQHAAGSGYAPKIYHKMTTLYLEQDELEKAREAAMSLVRSSQEESWVSLGRQLLEEIQREISVKPEVFGCLLPLSGPFAIYGEEVLNGIELGMELVGGTGEGSGLELVIRDTGGEPARALSGFQEMVDHENVMAVIGPLSSKAAAAVAEKAQEAGVPVITLTQKEGITEIGDMVFRNFLTPAKEVKRLLDAAMGEMDMKRFGILYPENTYGRFFMDLFWNGVEEMGGTITSVESYDPDETDFADPIKKMTGLYYPRPKALAQALRERRSPEEEESEIYPEEPQPIVDFEAVFIPDNSRNIAMIAPHFSYFDVLDVMLMGTNLWESPRLIETAGDYIQGAIFTSGFFEESEDPGVRKFQESYRQNFDSEPGILAATGYDTIRYLMALMAGKEIRTRRSLKKALSTDSGFQGVTGTISFDPTGEVKKEPLLLTVSGNHMRLFH